MKFNFFILTVALCLIVSVESRRQVKEYVIDLDKAPEDRYNELLPQFNDTVRVKWNSLIDLTHFTIWSGMGILEQIFCKWCNFKRCIVRYHGYSRKGAGWNATRNSRAVGRFETSAEIRTSDSSSVRITDIDGTDCKLYKDKRSWSWEFLERYLWKCDSQSVLGFEKNSLERSWLYV